MRIVLLISIVLGTLKVNAQTTTPGYYVTQKGDTIEAQIRIRKGAFCQVNNNFLNELEIIDGQAGPKTFKPDDINGFGFSYDGRRYVRFSKPTKDGSHKFLSPVFAGAKSSLYMHGTQTTGGTVPDQKTFYTFEKADGSYLFLRDILNNKFRAAVKEFYKDSPEVQQIIDSKLKYWLDLKKDLPEILQAANK